MKGQLKEPSAPGSVVVRGQTLKKVGPKGRKAIVYSAETNRRRAEAYANSQREKQGPAACEHCGAQPCGHLWTAPDRAAPRGERCCSQCSHDPVPGWQHTHTAWTEGHHHPVHALSMREGEQVFLRRDGVVMFLQLNSYSESAGREVPRVVYLGQQAEKAALFSADDGGAEVDGWYDREPCDVLWLAGRGVMAARQTAERVAVLNAELDAREAQREASEAVQAAEREQLRELEAQRAAAERARVGVEVEQRAEQREQLEGADEPGGGLVVAPVAKKKSARKKAVADRAHRARKNRLLRITKGRTARGSGKVGAA